MTEKQRMRNNVAYTSSLFSGLLLSIFGAKLYGSTFIDDRIVLAGVIALSTAGSFVIFRNYNKTYSAPSGFAIGQSIVTFGFGITSVLVILNFHFSTPPAQSFELSIIETGNQGIRHGGQPYGLIVHKGIKKRIVFKRKHQMTLGDTVRIETEQGLFGFEVIKNKEIVR